MAAEDNGNVGLLKPMSSSNEDLSEYTDADESISAPTEFLAEFLSAVMLKDYETALKYCKLILQYEPNNVTAKEFYPLILEKLKMQHMLEDDDDEENDDSSSSSSSSSDSESSSSDDSSDQDEEDEEEEDEEDEVDGVGEAGAADKRSKSSSDGGDATTGSYSSLEDDEPEIDQLAALAARFQIDNVNIGNGNKLCVTDFKMHHHHQHANQRAASNKIYANASAMASAAAAAVAAAAHTTTVYANETSLPFGSSDSESPTEPVSQQTIALLRAKVVPNKN